MQNQRQQPQQQQQQPQPQRENQTGQEAGFSNAQLFVVGFVGWLILQMFSPKEWNNIIGTFLTVEATALLLSSSLRTGGLPQQSIVQFLLASYLGYFIIYHGNQSDSSNEKSSASSGKSSSSKGQSRSRKAH